MPINVNAITEAIKRAGPTNVRMVPMPGQTSDGQHQIEVRQGSDWQPIAEGLSSNIARSLISQSQDRLLLG